ncbi:MAG: LytR C-terminal domain-containing protein [Mycobacteriales bacterium]|nr:LytR C-terminal domain-containing protein [Mycobacteriales bacterium]
MLQAAHDTGSDAWLRAQAAADDDAARFAAERTAAQTESFADPAALDEQDVLAGGAAFGDPTPGASSADWQLAPPGGDLEASEPVSAADPVWAGAPLEEPVLGSRAARRAAAHDDAISPVRAAAGALVAVAGVALGIGALLWARGDAPQGTPTVGSPVTQPTVTSSVTPTGTAQPTATSTVTAVPTTPVVVPTASPSAVAKAPVTVLNNSRRTGLAASAAQRFAAGGWPIRQTGNFTGRVTTTSVYYPPGGEAVARDFARQFGIGRVAPRFPGLPGTGLTVVLTRDYRSS